MNEINFLPQTVIRRRGTHARVVRESALIAAVAVLIVAWYVSSRGRLANLEELVSVRREEAAAAAEQVTEMVRLQRKHQVLLHQVRIERELAMPINHTSVIATIAQLMPRSISATDLAISAPEPAPQKAEHKPAPGDTSVVVVAPVRARGPVETPVLHVEMVGLAPNDVQIADFVGKLTEHPLFSDVKMIFSRGIDLKDARAREFRIEMDVRLDRDYRPKTVSGQGAAYAR